MVKHIHVNGLQDVTLVTQRRVEGWAFQARLLSYALLFVG